MNLGSKHSPETRAKMSAAKLGKPTGRGHGESQGHGNTPHELYVTWAMMKQRCLNPRAHAYSLYGGRGITVCDEWQSWVPFRDYVEANLGPRLEGMTLDRIDPDGNYEPGNVRWADAKGQANNRKGS